MTTEDRLRKSPLSEDAGRNTSPVRPATDTTFERAGRSLNGGGPAERTRPLRRSSVLSTESERAVIGCVLIDDFEVWGELEQYPLCADDFAMPEHKAIWRAFRWLYEQGMEVSCPSTVYALEQMGTIDAVDKWLGAPAYPGVATYLATVMSEHYSAKGCGAFLRMVKHYSDMRAPQNPRTGRETEI